MLTNISRIKSMVGCPVIAGQKGGYKRDRWQEDQKSELIMLDGRLIFSQMIQK